MAIAIASWLARKPFRELKKLKPKLAPPPSDATTRRAAPPSRFDLSIGLLLLLAVYHARASTHLVIHAYVTPCRYIAPMNYLKGLLAT